MRKKAGVQIGGTSRQLCHHLTGSDQPGQLLKNFLKIRNDDLVLRRAKNLNIDLKPYIHK